MNTDTENTIELYKKQMEDGINKVLSGELKEFELPFIPPDAAKTYLESLGCSVGELDTNGWQYDWWMDVYKPDDVEQKNKFVISGGGYYGEFRFELAESEDAK